jgi:hypothetical protein
LWVEIAVRSIVVIEIHIDELIKVLAILVGHRLQVIDRETPDIQATSVTTSEHRRRDIDHIAIVMATNGADQA